MEKQKLYLMEMIVGKDDYVSMLDDYLEKLQEILKNAKISTELAENKTDFLEKKEFIEQLKTKLETAQHYALSAENAISSFISAEMGLFSNVEENPQGGNNEEKYSEVNKNNKHQ